MRGGFVNLKISRGICGKSVQLKPQPSSIIRSRNQTLSNFTVLNLSVVACSFLRSSSCRSPVNRAVSLGDSGLHRITLSAQALAMASFAATSSQCNLLVRHGHCSSPRQQPFHQPALLAFPSSVSSQKFSFSSTSSARFGLSVLLTESKSVQTAAVRQLTGSLMKAGGLRFAVVVARFNEIVTKLLLEGALDTFRRYSVNEEDIDVVWVPGSFEIGVAAQSLGKSGKYHAVLCIGAVIKGDTSHYDAVVNSATSGVLSAGLNSGVPCIFGVLTCDDMDQALNRAGGKAGNKGSETALTAIEMASLFEHHLKQ